MSGNAVLVTGASGFLGGHVTLRLLEAGYSVVGSVRDASKADTVRAAIAGAGGDLARLSLVSLDLLRDEGWAEAARRCRYLVHVASPFVTVMPKDPNDLIRPAVEGTRRALNAAREAGHERIVLTSSLAAIDSGHADYGRVLTEEDWSDLSGRNVSSYASSKTLAEKAAWRLMERHGETARLAVINPGALLGPLLDRDPGTSAAIVLAMIAGRMPMVPAIRLEYVDVRDVAAAHVAAMTAPLAGGRRHICSGESLSLFEVAQIIRAEFPALADKLPRREMPGWAAAMLAPVNRSLRDARPFLGVRRTYDGSRGRALLGRAPIPARESIAATVSSMIDHGLA